MASATTGPGPATCRFVRMIPCSASTTKPVACTVPADAVSNARTRFTLMATTAGSAAAIVRSQLSSSSLDRGTGAPAAGDTSHRAIKLAVAAAAAAAAAAPTVSEGARPTARAEASGRKATRRARRSLSPTKLIRAGRAVP